MGQYNISGTTVENIPTAPATTTTTTTTTTVAASTSSSSCASLPFNGPVLSDGTIKPLTLSNHCLYKRYLGFEYGHEIWLWSCNSHHSSGKYQWNYDPQTGLIKIVGSEL